MRLLLPLAFILALASGAAFAHPAFASPVQLAADTGTGFTPLAPIPNLTQGATASDTGLQTFLRNLYFYLIGIAAVIAVFEIVWGGISISMGKDSISKQLEGKGRIAQALFGLVLVLSPALVFSIINPAILNLSVAIPKLSTPWTTWEPPPPAGPLSQVKQGAAPGTITTGTKFFPCGTDTTCKTATGLCTSAVSNGSAPVYTEVCTKSDGTIDTGNPPATNSSDTYSCSVAGETLSISCVGVFAAATP